MAKMKIPTANRITAKMLLRMTKKANIALPINRVPNPNVIQEARLFPTSDQKLILNPPHLMPKRFLSHASSSKECSLAFMTPEASKEMESFTHMETVTATMRTGKPDGCVCSWHLSPLISERGCYSNMYECKIKPCKNDGEILI